MGRGHPAHPKGTRGVPGEGKTIRRPGGRGKEARMNRTVLATVGAVIGSIFYIPFKALGICPGMALASGVHYAATVGKEPATDEYLVRAGCTGTYFITPG